MRITIINISLHELLLDIGNSTSPLTSRYYLTLIDIHSYIDIPSPSALSFTLTRVPTPTLTICFSLNVCGMFSISPHRRRSARANRVHACFSTGPHGRNFRQGIRKIHDTSSDPLPISQRVYRRPLSDRCVALPVPAHIQVCSGIAILFVGSL